MAQRFFIVDVFAQQPFSGNQLAVVMGDEPLSAEIMQRIAAETNYSETTFIMPAPLHSGAYRVRIFTPAREIDFAGHPLLGTAWVVRHYVSKTLPDEVQPELAIGAITVTFQRSAAGEEMAWFRAPSMKMGKTANREMMASALGIAATDLAADIPVHQVCAGTSAMIVPVRSLAAVQRSRLDLQGYAPPGGRGLAAADLPVLSATA